MMDLLDTQTTNTITDIIFHYVTPISSLIGAIIGNYVCSKEDNKSFGDIEGENIVMMIVGAVYGLVFGLFSFVLIPALICGSIVIGDELVCYKPERAYNNNKQKENEFEDNDWYAI